MDGDDRVFGDRTPVSNNMIPGHLSYTAGLGSRSCDDHVVRRVANEFAVGPRLAVGLPVLAFAQIGVHLVFFLHLGSGPDHTNNILALAFGLLIVFLVITGSVWIIANLNANMMDMPR